MRAALGAEERHEQTLQDKVTVLQIANASTQLEKDELMDVAEASLEESRLRRRRELHLLSRHARTSHEAFVGRLRTEQVK